MLDYISPRERSGRSNAVTGALKTKLRQSFLDNAHDPFVEAAKSIGLDVVRPTAQGIAKSPSPEHPYRIVKRKRPHKLVLSENDAAALIQY
jgi:hypothetical protein